MFRHCHAFKMGSIMLLLIKSGSYRFTWNMSLLMFCDPGGQGNIRLTTTSRKLGHSSNQRRGHPLYE
ncbi:hypothetical protein M758_8G163300 [Ceratodon purpureus]|nr:hypothetical protein M758_8G163300 [Ceratodon purpureus]